MDSISAKMLNVHYACKSTDANYQAPLHKLSVAVYSDLIVTECQVFCVLENLYHTATGLDQLPTTSTWSCMIFRRPLSHLCDLSTATSVMLRQLKTTEWCNLTRANTSKYAAPSDYKRLPQTDLPSPITDCCRNHCTRNIKDSV